MSLYVPTPRLVHYRALLSHDEPDLEVIKEAFIEWSTFDEYLIFRKENIYTSEKEWRAVKAAKRGNDVYAWRLKKRLGHLRSIPNVRFFNHKDRSRRHKTRTLFIMLTYKRDDRLDVVWEEIGSDYNRWITGLRRKYGKIEVVRTWEAHGDGYPHIHCVLLFEEIEFETFLYNGKWRINRKDDISRNWHFGFVDVLALSSIRAGVNYMVEYLTKAHRVLIEKGADRRRVLTLALMLIFRKHSFSISRSLSEVLKKVSCKMKSLGQVDLEGNPIYKWVLVGFWAGGLGVWSKKLSYIEFIKTYSSDSFTKNNKL